jgi:hypothetical protein
LFILQPISIFTSQLALVIEVLWLFLENSFLQYN